MSLSVTDLFAGAGGSSSGAESVAGVFVRMATNHWKLAMDTHNTNMPHVDHDVADIKEIPPQRYPYTDILWASPECTYWSQARGEKQDFAEDDEQAALFGEDGKPLPSEAAQRSRALMEDVPRFADHHRYKAIIVENVPDILKWNGLKTWLGRMRRLDYRAYVVPMNSAFAQQLGAPAPQLRDRVYFVFVQKCYREPDLNRWTRPLAWCPACDTVVTAMMALKKDAPVIGRYVGYGRQYVWRCPSVTCRNSVVQPYVLPALAALDLSVPGIRIGDRALHGLRLLQPKTMARIEAGVRRYFSPGAPAPVPTAPVISLSEYRAGTARLRPLTAGLGTKVLTVPMEGREGKQARPAILPMRSQTTRRETGLLVPAGGTWNDDAQTITDRPMRTRTTRESDGLVVIPLRNNNRAKRTVEPLDTVAANGNHHALLMRNNTGGAEISTPITEPARTITTAGHQSLVWHPDLLLAYDTGTARRLTQPMPTQTTVEGDALLQAAIEVEDCYFRMLTPDEIKLAMAFREDFVLLGNQREQVKLAGNAVTPPAARDLIAAVVEAITGDEPQPAYALAA